MVLSLRQKGYNIEVMDTEHAVSTYNYLCDEGRLVGAALIPPEKMPREEGEHGFRQGSGPAGYLNSPLAVPKVFLCAKGD